MAVLSFKLDESFDNRFMSVGGWFGEANEWRKLESAWQRRIDFLNKKNRADQQISRFHATDMNRLVRDFANWNQAMSADFAKKLIGFLSKRSMIAVAIGTDMNVLRDVFPQNEDEGKRKAYTLALKMLMVEIAHIMEILFPEDQVLIVHDHGNWDHEAVEAYNAMANDQRWQRRRFFSGISQMTGKQSVGLQAADLMAFEAHSSLRRKIIKNDSELRKAVKALYDKKVLVRARWLDRDAAVALQQAIEETNGYQPTEIF